MYFPVSDLLHTFSLVNKLWKQEARAVVRDFRVCKLAFAKITYPEDKEALVNLSIDNTIPFNGITVDYNKPFPEDTSDFLEDVRGLIKAMHLKYIYIRGYDMEDAPEVRWTADAGRMDWVVAQALTLKANTIEEMLFGRLEPYWYFPKLPNLPRLKSLTFHPKQDLTSEFLRYSIDPIVRCAPGLKYINILVSRVMPQPEILHLFRRFYICNASQDWIEVCRLVVTKKLVCTDLELEVYARETEQEFLDLLFQFLQTNKDVLEALTIRVLSLARLIASRRLKDLLNNVKHLTLVCSTWGGSRPEIVLTFEEIPEVFPYVESVTLTHYYTLGSDGFVWDDNKSNMFKAWGVRKLTLREPVDDAETWRFLSTVFPNLDSLSAHTLHNVIHSRYLIESLWPNLKSIVFH